MIDPYSVSGFISYFLLALALGLGWVLGVFVMGAITRKISAIFTPKAKV